MNTNEKLKETEVIKAIYLTQWDTGFLLEQPCKVNVKTFEVFDVDYDFETLDMLENLQGEWVIINGIKYPVISEDEYRAGVFNSGAVSESSIYWRQ